MFSRCRKGFMLLELTLAMMLVSIALVGLLEAHRATLDSRTANIRQIESRFLIERQIGSLADVEALEAGMLEGSFEPDFRYQYSMLTSRTELPGVFRVEVSVSGVNSGESTSRVVFVRAKTPEEPSSP